MNEEQMHKHQQHLHIKTNPTPSKVGTLTGNCQDRQESMREIRLSCIAAQMPANQL